MPTLPWPSSSPLSFSALSTAASPPLGSENDLDAIDAHPTEAGYHSLGTHSDSVVHLAVTRPPGSAAANTTAAPTISVTATPSPVAATALSPDTLAAVEEVVHNHQHADTDGKVIHRGAAMDQDRPVSLQGWRQRCSQGLAVLKIIVQYLAADNARNKRSFAIGLITVYLVVTFLSLIQNALDRSSIIFVKLAEDQTGAFDFLMTADPSRVSVLTDALLDYTAYNRSLGTVASIQGAVPRWFVPVNVTAAGPTLGITQSYPDGTQATATLMVMDSDLEASVGFAPLWPYRSLGVGECHVTASMLRTIRVQPDHGQKVVIQFNVLAALQSNLNSVSGSGGASQSGSNSSSTDTGSPSFQPTVPVQKYLPIPVGQPIVVPVTALNGANNSALFPQWLAGLGVQYNGTDVIIDPSVLSELTAADLDVSFQCTVVNDISSPYGRYPSVIGNVVIIDQLFAQSLLSTDVSQFVVNPLLGVLIKAVLLGQTQSFQFINLSKYAMAIFIILQNRYAIYTAGIDFMNAELITYSNQIALALGVDGDFLMQSILSEAMQALFFIQVFLNEIFFTVVAVLVLLAVILIASLLLSDVEDKTFEYGMLRTLGMHKSSLVVLVILQSAFFSIPGVLLGLLCSYLVFVPIAFFLSSYTGTPIDVSMTTDALVLGIVTGIALPIMGMVLPIRRALTKTIRDALDVYHNVVFDTQVQIQKLEKLGVSVNELIVSVILVGIGFLVYYLIPLTFAYGRLDLFFRIMTTIMLSMVIGQLILSQVFRNSFERLFVWFLTFISRDIYLTQVISKNLIAHVSRNRKTSIMFTLCMGYILFAGTMFSLQTNSLAQNLEWVNGSDLNIAGPDITQPLPEKQLSSFLDSRRVDSSTGTPEQNIVVGFSYATYPLNDYYPVSSMKISRLAAFGQPTIQLIGLEQNFLNATMDEYAVVSEISYSTGFPMTLDGSTDYVSPLYDSETLNVRAPESALSAPFGPIQNTNFGNSTQEVYSKPIPCILAEATRSIAFTDAHDPVLLSVSYQITPSDFQTKTYFSQPVALMRKFPGFPAVNRLQTSNFPMFISLPSYEKIYRDISSNVGAPKPSNFTSPKGFLFVKLSSSATDLQVEEFINTLNSMLAGSSFKVTNLRSEIASTQSAAQMINVVFIIVAFVGTILSFFVLLLSFIANVRENSWEIGVVRSIGLNRGQVARMYIYEALSILFACILLGSILGVFTASALTLQTNLFTEMPFMIYFPTILFTVVICFAVGLAVFGSYYPIQAFNERPIAITLRGG